MHFLPQGDELIAVLSGCFKDFAHVAALSATTYGVVPIGEANGSVSYSEIELLYCSIEPKVLTS